MAQGVPESELARRMSRGQPVTNGKIEEHLVDGPVRKCVLDRKKDNYPAAGVPRRAIQSHH